MSDAYKTKTLIYPDELHEDIIEGLKELIGRSVFTDDQGKSYFGLFEPGSRGGETLMVLKDRDFMCKRERDDDVYFCYRDAEAIPRNAQFWRERIEAINLVFEMDSDELKSMGRNYFFDFSSGSPVPIDIDVVKMLLNSDSIEEMTDRALDDPQILRSLGLRDAPRPRVRREIYRIARHAADDKGLRLFPTVAGRELSI